MCHWLNCWVLCLYCQLSHNSCGFHCATFYDSVIFRNLSHYIRTDHVTVFLHPNHIFRSFLILGVGRGGVGHTNRHGKLILFWKIWSPSSNCTPVMPSSFWQPQIFHQLLGLFPALTELESLPGTEPVVGFISTKEICVSSGFPPPTLPPSNTKWNSSIINEVSIPGLCLQEKLLWSWCLGSHPAPHLSVAVWA